jgi:glutamate-1-semialdehyde aminotransferase
VEEYSKSLLYNDSEQDYAIYLFYVTQEVFRKAHTQENLSGCNLGQDKNRRCALGNYRLGYSLQDILHDKNVDATLQGYPSMFQVPFTKQERVDNYRDFTKCNQDLLAKLQGRLIKNRVMIDESNSEPFYTSAAHDDNDLEQPCRHLR